MRIIFCLLCEELGSVSVMVLRACLCRERTLQTLGVGELQCAIHLIGGDVVEALALIALGQTLPIFFCCLQKSERAHNVGVGEGERVLDGTVHMALCREVNDAVDTVLLHELLYKLIVADVALHKGVVGLVLDVVEVGKITSIGQFVEIDDFIIRIFVDKQAHNMRADKTGAARDDYVTHKE